MSVHSPIPHSIPSYQEFMKPVLEFIADGNEHAIRDIIFAISTSAQFNFTESEKKLKIKSGKQRVIDGRIGWAKTYLVQAGLIVQPRRAVCIISKKGLNALASGAIINTKYLTQFDEYKAFLTRSNKFPTPDQEQQAHDVNCENDTQTPTEQLENTISTFNAALAVDLLKSILNTSPAFFEKLVVELMLALGYGGSFKDAGATTKYNQDGGIDGVIKEDKLGLEMIYLQAKRYKDTAVGRPELQKFVGALAMHKAKKGVFITTSSFNNNAQEYVKQIEQRIVLIDGEQLTDLMIEHNLGVSVKQTYEIKSIDSDYFMED